MTLAPARTSRTGLPSAASPTADALALVPSTPATTTRTAAATSLEREFAEVVRRRGLTLEGARELGEVAERAVRSGSGRAEIGALLRRALGEVLGPGGEALLRRLLGSALAHRLAYLVPGLDLLQGLLDLKELATVPAAGGAHEAAVEARLQQAARLRDTLARGGDPQALATALAPLLATPAGALALQDVVRAALQPGTTDSRAALLHGLPALARLAARGVAPAREALHALAGSGDPALREAARRASAPPATPDPAP